jgi:uncharacterized membrane protein
MKIPGSLILVGYVIVCGIAVRLLTGWRKGNEVGVYLLLAAFFIGWFFVITYLVERDEKRNEEAVVVRTVKSGIEVIKIWLLYILGILVVGGVGSFLVR